MRKRKKTAKARSNTAIKKKRVYKKKAVVKIRKNAAPKVRNSGKWTESQFWQFIRSSLRSRSRFWIPRLEALKKARRTNQSADKRLKWEFFCYRCSSWFPQTQIQIHHQVEAGQLNCASDLPGFVERLFAEDGWIAICKNCHKAEHKKEKV